MKVRLILSILALLFVVGSASAETEARQGKWKGFDLVLRGEVPRDTNRSIPIIPIEAIQGDDNIMHIIFAAPLGTVQILVDGQLIESAEVVAFEQETAFSIEGWTPGIYKLEFKTPEGGYVYGEFVIEEE